MSKVLVTDSYLTAIGDAIRAQLGTSVSYKPGQMADAIAAISGGGTTTIVGYPVHNDGKMHIYIDLPRSLLNITLSLKINGTCTIDWGDGLRPTTATGSGSVVSKTCSYSEAGMRHIQITPESNTTVEVTGGSVNGVSRSTLITSADNIAMSDACLACIKAIESPFSLSTSTTGSSSRAFYGCTSLGQLVLTGATGIGPYCCGGIAALTKVTLPSSLTTIGSYAFTGTGLTIITIPASVTNISSNAFSSCTKLTEIHFTGTTPPNVADANVFGSLPTFCKIYVPTGYLTEYTTKTNYPSASTYTYIEE